MSTYRHICFLLLLAAFAATSCVYDFRPQVDGEGGYLIVEGDIVVGDSFDILTSWSSSLVDTTQGDERWQILNTNKMHIEASDGTRYENQFSSGSSSSDSLTLSTAFSISLIISQTERNCTVLSSSIQVMRPCQLLFCRC